MPEKPSTPGLSELRGLYVGSLPAKWRTYCAALRSFNFQALAVLGHQLKGSGSSYGFAELSDLGARIEEAAENRRIVVLEQLRSEFEDLMNSLLHSHAHAENL